MNDVLRLTSPLPPSVNHYLAYRAIMKNGKPMAMSYKTQEAVKYQSYFTDYVKKEVVKQNYDLEPNKTRHFYIDTVFYFDRIDRDPNNYFKCMLDAITDTQLVWLDDNVTCERVQRVYYDPKNPRVELIIYPVDYIGIFYSSECLRGFENKCAGCKKYNRNCTILQKAKEGRIQDEVVDLVCQKFTPIK